MVTILRNDLDDDIINKEIKKLKDTEKEVKFITDNITF